MGSVYRARDRLSGQELALKCITLPSEQSTAQSATAFAATFAATSAAAAGAIDSGDSGRDTVAQGTDRTVLDADGEARVEVQPSGDQQALRLALAQEFRTLASLRHPHIISVLDYGFDANRAPFFTMELLAGAMPLLEAAVGLPLQAQIALLVQIAQALSYLHRHGVIHRDLKPGNVLVVQTADGPCAKVLDFGLAMAKPRAQQGTREIAGTLAYMAPESVLGEPLTEATDLYALGMMAFELIAGRHPFDLASAGELVLAILDRTPEVDSLAVPEALRDTLRRLLHKRPRERPRDGAQVAQELASAVGLPRAAEPAALRESYLQAARFIGRTDETATLLAALERAVAPGGKGAAFLVGGESGVGKSRLLDEVRTQALVRGALVLRGQASQHAGAAFQVFRDVLRPLCLYVELSELEASVLLALIPDLPQLLSRPVASPPELEPRAMQERVFLVVNSVLARIHKPLLILLEDLQWAGAESVALLSLLVQRAQTRPHLWIGSYRDDEAADLPMRLPDPQVLRLHRLARTEVAALSASMLGQESVRPDIVELLHRETEGNVFFLVEVMRALAEASGELREVGQRTLPARVFAGGMRAVVERRLQRVPSEAWPLLKLAAVAGRQLDLRVMRAAVPGADTWLLACAEAAVLEVSEQRWQFAHDKLRERLLEEVRGAERRELHARVAQAIETVYVDREPLAAALAYHHREAGEPEEAARYDVLAGELEIKEGALQSAAGHLQRALAYYERSGGDVLLRARLRRQLSEISFAMGQVDACIAHFGPGRALLGRPYPSVAPQRVVQTLAAAGVQVAHTLAPALRRVRPADAPVLKELIALNRAAQEAFVWHGQDGDALLCGIGALNAAEEIGAVNEDLIMGYAFMAYLLCILGQERAARYYLDKAAGRLRTCDDPLARYHLLRAKAAIYVMWRQWEPSLAAATEAVQIGQGLGDVGKELFCTLQQASAALYSGRHADARGYAARLIRKARAAGNAQYRGWAQCLSGAVALRSEAAGRGQAPLQEAYEIATRAHDTLGEIYASGLLAIEALHRADRGEARRWAEHTLRCLARTPLPAHGLLEGYAGPVEVFMRLAADGAASEPVSLRQKARQALDILKGYARRIPMGRPRALLWEGRWALLHDRREHAVQLLDEGLQEALRSGMRYDAALLHAALASALPAGDPAAAASRRAALRGFTELGLERSAIERSLPLAPGPRDPEAP